MSRTLRVCFDFISPYAYVAWHRVYAIAERHDASIDPEPVLFAAMLNTHGQKGPAEIPSKRLYTFKDAFRKAFRAGLPPLTPPPAHPFNPLLALRVATAVKRDAVWSHALRPVIDGLFGAVWAGGGGVEDASSVARVLHATGLDADAVMARAQTDEVKNALRDATDRAIRDGAFGVPSVFVQDELFWGVDGLESLVEFLEGRDSFDPRALEQWRDLPASAAR